MPNPTDAFAGYPAVFLHDQPDGKVTNQALWGDHLRLLDEHRGRWTRVRARGEGNSGWVLKKDIQTNRLLEVNFVDIGQGDGCFIVTPDDKRILIDAGQFDNMFRFLRWRFNLRRNPERVITINTAILSHPDADHYAGFQFLADSKQFRFERVLHNGIIERAGDHLFGKPFKSGRRSYVACIDDLKGLKKLFRDPKNAGKKAYPKLMNSLFGCAEDIRMISSEDEYVPGYERRAKLSLEVLGPVPETIKKIRALRTFGAEGKTKNGHSVVLMLRYGKLRMLLGGDLNIPAEEYLLAHHTGLDAKKSKEETIINKARKTFQADIAKACHHGSADFSIPFLRAVNPIVTVVSSGDEEPHCHPRPDALGAFGKYSRGDRPLIFSTELARSSPEQIKNPNLIRKRVAELVGLLSAAEDDVRRKKLAQDIDKTVDLDRSVATYGMITVRSDGNRVVVSQKLERPRELTGERWDVHRFERDENGELQYMSKH